MEIFQGLGSQGAIVVGREEIAVAIEQEDGGIQAAGRAVDVERGRGAGLIDGEAVVIERAVSRAAKSDVRNGGCIGDIGVGAD